ncbi:hypothetical protein BKA70DRAFT_1237985 [Coprinopsis sp. MPI-PUGE-AT-0042]|nr:hypothetical protein BKA70DRAFT_1237985 [Coprinopsis sp. MPI-PUGE-AT-0042]
MKLAAKLGFVTAAPGSPGWKSVGGRTAHGNSPCSPCDRTAASTRLWRAKPRFAVPEVADRVSGAAVPRTKLRDGVLTHKACTEACLALASRLAKKHEARLAVPRNKHEAEGQEDKDRRRFFDQTLRRAQWLHRGPMRGVPAL